MSGVYAVSRRYWHLSQVPGSHYVMNNKYWEEKMGYKSLEWNMKQFAN